MPSPLPRQVQWSLFARPSPLTAAFPVKKSGRLLQLFFRGLLSVHSRYGRHARGVAKRPFPSRAPTALLPPPPPRLLRVERNSSRAGVAPAVVQRFSRPTVSPTVAGHFCQSVVSRMNKAFPAGALRIAGPSSLNTPKTASSPGGPPIAKNEMPSTESDDL